MDTAAAPHVSAHDSAANFTPRQRKLALTVVALAFIMDLLDTTIVNIAIPSIQANLGASYATIQWLIAGYSLAFAVLLITGGRMGDVFGYKKMFLIGVAGFTLASLLSGLAWTPLVLIIARLIQGGFAALMVPQVMSSMQVMYPPSERGSVFGLFGALAGVAATLGPIIGALLIQGNIFGLDWRPIFLINIPVGIFALIAGWRVLPNGKSPHPLKLDLVGTGLIVTSMFLLVYPLVQGREYGWPLWTFIMMIASLPVLAIFIWWQIKKMALDGSALVVPSLFRKSSFSIGLLLNLVFQMALGSYFLISTLMLQIGLGYSVLRAGLTNIPFAVGVSLSIGLVGQILIPKIGRYVLTIGTVLLMGGIGYLTYIFAHFGLKASYWELLPGLLVAGFGMGFVMAPLFSVTLNDVDHSHAGSASGMLNAVDQLGGAIGVALIGVVFFGQLGSFAPTAAAKVTPQIQSQLASAQLPEEARTSIVASFNQCFIDRSKAKDSNVVPASCKTAQADPRLPKAVSDKIASTLATSAKDANNFNFVHAYKAGVIYLMSLFGLVFLLSFTLPRKIKAEGELETA